MSFKTHLAIISIIVAMVLLVQFLLSSKPAPQPVVQVVQTSEFNISVAHASWGLNCRLSKTDDSDPYKNSSSSTKMHDDNVLTAVSNICNGKEKCDILIDPTVLGEDPLPSCMSKMLQIEYRCFSFDRIWVAKSQAGTLSINCAENK